jgi:citrate lyase subunit beta/citryl-CoA lyase
MPVSPVLASRSILLVNALNETAVDGATRSAADAIAIDLASTAAYERHDEARAAAAHALETIAESGRPVIARLCDTRSGALEADIDAVVGARLTAVILPGAEEPQDVRDVDVLVRKHEMRRGMEPGSVRLLPEIDSAEGLMALPALIGAVDRHSGIIVDLDGLRHDLHLGPGTDALYAHAMAQVGIAAHAARLPWIVFAPTSDASAANLASRAHGLGAAGAVLRSEASARGMNLLFTPDEAMVDTARAMVTEWERLRAEGTASAVANGAILDRRTVRHARALLAQVEAIGRREQVT